MSRSNAAVLALIVLNYLIEGALITHVDGFQLPPVAIFLLSVAWLPIAPMLAILPQLGIRVPMLPTIAPLPAAAEALEPAPLHPAP